LCCVFCFYFSSCMLPVFRDCPFLIASSVSVTFIST
jgi:hypothetical protein